MRLHDYQRVAVQHLRDTDRSGLFLDMGLGKTAIALSALERRHLPVLVIAPKRVAEAVWPAEARIWRPDLVVVPAVGGPKVRRDILASPADIVVLGRDNIRDIADVQPHEPWSTLILDELSGFKNRSTARFSMTRAFLKKRRVPHVWGLTGTPSPNGLIDLWAQMYLLDDGEALGTTLTGYRARYFVPGRQLPSGVVTSWTPRPGAERQIHQRLAARCLSMGTDGRVQLPPVTQNHVSVPLPTASRRVYDRLRDELIVDLRSQGGAVHTAVNAAVLTSRLSQVTAGFLYEDENAPNCTRLNSAKLDAVKEIVEGTGSPVLVFYRFKEELRALKHTFPSAEAVASDSSVIDRWNAGRIPVLLAHPASAGHGLNLQSGGHTIVWTSLPWSSEEWEQANKRLARQGQKNPVVIHVLISPGTVDEAILKRLTAKISVQKALLDFLEVK